MSLCNCDFDYDWEAHRYFPVHTEVCPLHDPCEYCAETTAIVLSDGHKLCAECAR